jgi:hypothetical protein
MDISRYIWKKLQSFKNFFCNEFKLQTKFNALKYTLWHKRLIHAVMATALDQDITVGSKPSFTSIPPFTADFEPVKGP